MISSFLDMKRQKEAFSLIRWIDEQPQFAYFLTGRGLTPHKKQAASSECGGPVIRTKKPHATFYGLDGCSLFVQDEFLLEFFKHYASDVKKIMRILHEKNNDIKPPLFYLCEVTGPTNESIIRVFLEIDLKNLDYAVVQEIHEKFHQPDHFVGTLCKHVISIIRGCFKSGNRMYLSIIAEKRFEKYISVRRTEQGNNAPTTSCPEKVNSGIHLRVPEVFLKIENVAKLRDLLVAELDVLMPVKDWLKIDASWNDLLDRAPVSGRLKSLRLPGSFKTEPCSNCPKTGCSKCMGSGKVPKDSFYYPSAWFFMPLDPADVDHAINATPFPLATTSKEYSSMSLEMYELMDNYLLTNMSLRLNGNVVSNNEQFKENPFRVRKTETHGFEIDDAKREQANKVQRMHNSHKRSASSMATQGDNNKLDSKFWVTQPLTISAYDNPSFAQNAENLIHSACKRYFTFDLIKNSTKHAIYSNAGQQKSLVSQPKKAFPALEALRKLHSIGPDLSRPIIVQPDHQNIKLTSIAAGMVDNRQRVYKFILDKVPFECYGSLLLKHLQTQPFVLSMIFYPAKDEASQTCKIAGRKHASNNVYFEMILPLYMEDMSSLSSEAMTATVAADWSANLCNWMQHNMTRELGLPYWLLLQRCFSEKNCKGKTVEYAIPWPDVYKVVQPLVKQTLDANGFCLNKKSKLFEHQ